MGTSTGRVEAAGRPGSVGVVGAAGRPNSVGSVSDEPLRWAWEFDGRTTFCHSNDALLAGLGEEITMLIRSRAIASPSNTRFMLAIGNGSTANQVIGIQGGGAPLVGRGAAATTNTWFSPGGGTSLSVLGGEWRTFAFRARPNGSTEDQAWTRYTPSGAVGQATRNTSERYITQTPTKLGLGAIVNISDVGSSFSAFRCAEIAIWDRYIPDDELAIIANKAKGLDLTPHNPAIWFRPERGKSQVSNRGYVGGTLQSGAGSARPLVVPDGPDHYLETLSIVEVGRQSTSETGSNEVLQGLAVGNGESYGSGAWNDGVGGASRYLHKYTGALFTPHEDNNGPLGSGIYELLTSAVTTAGTVNHAGDLAYIPSTVNEATYQNRIAVPYLDGNSSGHGVIALFDPSTMGTVNTYRPDVLFSSASFYGYLDSVCYWYRELPYTGNIQEGLVAGSLRRIFCADYHAGTPSILWEESVDGSYGLPQGLVQLGIPTHFLASIGFANETTVYNGIYEFDVWGGDLRPVRRWVPPVPPAGHYEGIDLAAGAGEFWQGEGVNAVRYSASMLNFSRDASLYRPGV